MCFLDFFGGRDEDTCNAGNFEHKAVGEGGLLSLKGSVVKLGDVKRRDSGLES